MKKVFLISDDDDFSEWIKEELKEYARVIRATDQSDFFIQQWETTDAEIAIILVSAIDSFGNFSKSYNQIISNTSRVPFIFIYSKDNDEEEILKFKSEEQIWIEWNDLDFGLIEKRLEAFYSIKELQSSVLSVTKQQEEDTSEVYSKHPPLEMQSNEVNVHVNKLHTEEISKNKLNNPEHEIAAVDVDELVDDLLQEEANDFELVDITESPSNSSVPADKSIECVESFEKDEDRSVNIQPEEVLSETDEFLIPRNQKSKANRSILPSLPKHGEVKERIVFTERIIGTVIIALTGTNRGSGTTYSAIQIASYLRASGFDVACVEMVDLECGNLSLKYLDEGNRKQTKVEKGFHLNGIDFYKEVDSEKYIQIIHAQYQYVVVDLGQILTSTVEKPVEGRYFKEFLRAHLSIVCTKPGVWDFPYLISYLDKILVNSWSKEINLFINLADDKRFDYFCSRFEPKIKKALQLKFFQNEFVSDPFDNKPSMLKTLLVEVLPKTRKEKWFFSLFKTKEI